MTILIIALLHAVPIVIVAAWTNSKFALIVATLIMGVIGVATGNPLFVAADLIAVAFGFALGRLFVNAQKHDSTFQIRETAHETTTQIHYQSVYSAPEIVETATPVDEKNQDSSLGVGIITFVIVVSALFAVFKDKAPQAPPIQVQQQSVTPSASVQSFRAEPPRETAKKRVANGNKGEADLRHCLNQRTDAEIAKCANQRK